MHQHFCLEGGGECGERLRALDWAHSALGPVAQWPLSLKTAVQIVLSSQFPMMVHWGPSLITFYNDAYAPSLGHKHPGHLGQPAREWWAEMWDQLTPIFDQVLGGQAFYVEDARYTPDRDGVAEEAFFTHCHSPLWDDNGKVAGIFLVVTETTRGILAERRLKELNAHLEGVVAERTEDRNALWQLSQDLMLRCTVEGVITAVNPAWTQLLGWTEAELLGNTLFAFIHDLDQVSTAQEARDLGNGMEYSRLDNRYWHKDGSYRWISWSSRAGDGVINAVGRDITQDKQRIEALAAAEDAMRQSQKMEAVGQLTGGVAHDFNNLLTIIRSSVDFLKRPALSEERRQRYLTAVSDTVDRASKLTAQLLAFARRQALKPEVFEVGAKLRALADMLNTLMGARISVITELPGTACFIEADTNQFETALINLAVNARDAMDGAGTLIVELRHGIPLPAIRGHAPAAGPFAEIALTDTGEGISDDTVARIFEPFFTTKQVGKGTGLGLSQVFGFAKQSGGDVTVTSAVGKGARFSLYLPEVQAQVAPYTDVPNVTQAALGTGQRVLVVEDNIEVGRFATQMLEDLGYRPTWAVNAEDAVALLGQNGAGFDVVFSDVVMPGMGGIELAKWLALNLPQLPVVLATGYSHALALGGAQGIELLHKPYSTEELGQVLKRVITRA
ncbi:MULTISPECIES: hybrid sensor histidine kinase/response regulator [Pseudomonas]|nr:MULTISPECIES: PAS domain-containing sensor histidine kinase [Pseudomonas]